MPTDFEGYRDRAIMSRDNNRPEMEDVVEIIDDMVLRIHGSGDDGFRSVLRGPDTWIWEYEKTGKTYILSRSTMPDAFGHPLLTVRQVVAPVLDAYLTTSGLVIGGPHHELVARLSNMLIGHSGAHAGLLSTMSVIINQNQDDAVEHVRQMSSGVYLPSDAPKGELN